MLQDVLYLNKDKGVSYFMAQERIEVENARISFDPSVFEADEYELEQNEEYKYLAQVAEEEGVQI